MLSISKENQSSIILRSISDLEIDDYDDTIPFPIAGNPPIINKGGLTTSRSNTGLPEITPTTFSCIVDWVGFVFNIDASYRIDRAEQVQDRADFDSGKINAILPQGDYSAIHTVEDKAQQFLNDLSRVIPLLTFHMSGHGRFAYKHMADLYRDGDHVGTFCFGGTTNRGTAALMLKGKGCSGVDMAALRKFIEPLPGGHLTRVDVAHDDLEGKRPVNYYVEQFHVGNFFIKGARPKPRNGGDWTSENDEKGRTFYVGSKRNGKEACIYEKGKQLGDPVSPWVRVEIRFTNDDHKVPFDILTSPEMYFAGSYPVLADTSIFHDRCEVIKKHAETALESMFGYMSDSYGKLVNVALSIGKTPEWICNRVVRDGIPKRLILPLPPMPQYTGAIA